MTLRARLACFVPMAACLLMGCTSDDVDLGGPGGGGPNPATYPRLVVAAGDGVHIWDKATSVTSDTPSNVHFGQYDNAVGLALDGDTLAVATGAGSDTLLSGVHLFANASQLTSEATPSRSIPASGFTGDYNGGFFANRQLVNIQADSRHNLWVRSGIDSGSVHFVPAGATAPTAHFGNLLRHAAYADGTDKLLGSNIEMVRSPLWTQAASKTGTIRDTENQFTQYKAQQLVISGGRLFSNLLGVDGERSDIAIWNDLSTITASREPDVILRDICKVGTGSSFIQAISVTNDVLAVLSASYDAQQRETMYICLYKGASNLTAVRQPDGVASDPSLQSTSHGTDKAWVTKEGHLFVLGRGGIFSFRNATTAPAFVTRLGLPDDAAVDLLVLE